MLIMLTLGAKSHESVGYLCLKYHPTEKCVIFSLSGRQEMSQCRKNFTTMNINKQMNQLPQKYHSKYKNFPMELEF